MSREEEAITLRAAEWMLELQQRDVQMERILAWQAWMAADPRHKEAFDRLLGVHECVCLMESPPWPTDSETANDRSDVAEALSDARGERDRKRRQPRWLPLGALAAGLLAITVGILIVAPRIGLDVASLVHFGDTVIATEIGELRRVQLSDGSKVTLGGFSRVSIDMTDETRRIVLERGEAFFEVAKDPKRPFLVEVDHAAIRAVGTAFNVRRAGSKVSVSIAEGIVEVIGSASRAVPPPCSSPARGSSGALLAPTLPSPASGGGEMNCEASERPSPFPMRIVAGQSLQFEPSHISAPTLIAVEPETIATWRNGQRQYLAEPLANIVADLNRYSARHIVIEDPAVGQLAVTGSIFERDIERWVRSLEAALPVTVQEGDDELIIRAR